MTTIAFRDGIMAADSRCTDEFYMVLTDCQKIYRLSSGALLGTAGDDDARALLDALDSVHHETALPSRHELAELEIEFTGLLALPDDTLWQIEVEWVEREHEGHWSGSVSQIRFDFAAVGSGAHFAMGAMGHGATAEEAVEVATKFDIFSALPLQTESLRESDQSPAITNSKTSSGGSQKQKSSKTASKQSSKTSSKKRR